MANEKLISKLNDIINDIVILRIGKIDVGNKNLYEIEMSIHKIIDHLTTQPEAKVDENKASIEACRILRKKFISADHPQMKEYDDAYIIRNYPDEWSFFMDGWKSAKKLTAQPDAGFHIYKGDEVNCIHNAIMRTLDSDQMIVLRDKLIRRTPTQPEAKEKMSDKEFVAKLLIINNETNSGLFHEKSRVLIEQYKKENE